MISISYIAMGILIAVVNCLFFMIIALFLMLYLKSQKEVSAVQKLTDKITDRSAERIKEIGSLLKKALALEEAQPAEIAKVVHSHENELYTVISETYINRDSEALLDLDCKVETLFKHYVEVVDAHINTGGGGASDNTEFKASINVIFKKYMAATDAALDEAQEYTTEQMLELVEKHVIKLPKKIKFDYAQLLSDVSSSDMSHEDLMSEYEQMKTKYLVVIEELKIVFVEYAAIFQLDTPESGVWSYENIAKHLNIDTSSMASEDTEEKEPAPEPEVVTSLIPEETNEDAPKDENSQEGDVEDIEDIEDIIGVNAASDAGKKPDENHEQAN